MVSPETRNNIVTIVAIISIAVLITAFIYIFSNSLIQVAQHGEQTVNVIGKSVAGNVSKSADINQMNLKQFNRSMTDVIHSNDRIVDSNKQAISNLSTIVQNFSKVNTKYLADVNSNISNNSILFKKLLAEHQHTTSILENISKQLGVLIDSLGPLASATTPK